MRFHSMNRSTGEEMRLGALSVEEVEKHEKVTKNSNSYRETWENRRRRGLSLLVLALYSFPQMFAPSLNYVLIAQSCNAHG